jgi:hypothetical protein
MQITVKVKPHAKKNPAALVRDCVRAAESGATVEEVFPGVARGRRAGLVTVSLPDEVSERESQAILARLREDNDIEYAEPATPRKAR